MLEIKIKLEEELASVLNQSAQSNNMSIENFILRILNKYFVPKHTINQEDMAKGYEEMGEINLTLSK